MAKEVKTIGVLTSGGDAPGMNAAIRAVVRSGIAKGLKVKGIQKGYNGLLNEEIIDMTARDVSDTISRGGTDSVYCPLCRSSVLRKDRQEAQRSAESMVSTALLSSEETVPLHGAQKLAALGYQYHRTYREPSTWISACTEYTIGFDTAVNTAMEAIDKVRDTSTSHERCSIIEVMGT